MSGIFFSRVIWDNLGENDIFTSKKFGTTNETRHIKYSKGGSVDIDIVYESKPFCTKY